MLLKSKEMLNLSNNFLNSHNIKLNNRIFLSAFLIEKFPKDVLGTIGNMGSDGLEISTSESDDELLQIAKNIVNFLKIIILIFLIIRKFSTFYNLIINFKNKFIEWQSDDKNKLIDSLIREYHLLSVNILNAPESAKPILEECKSNLLDTAKMIGGTDAVNTIMQYQPVVIDTEQLTNAYTQAFWDIMKEEYATKKYDKVMVALELIVSQLCVIKNKPADQQEIRETIDVQFIKQRLEHDAYPISEMYTLAEIHHENHGNSTSSRI